MNVTFHALSGLAVAALLGSKQRETGSVHLFTRSDLSLLASGFVAGVALHGVLDLLPHSYPIKSSVDVVLGVALIFIAISTVRSRHVYLLGACFFGSLFPDLVDLAPAIVNKHFGLSLPVVKLFPWHWPQYSGSIYDGSRSAESLSYHLLVVGVSFFLLYSNRGWLSRRE